MTIFPQIETYGVFSPAKATVSIRWMTIKLSLTGDYYESNEFGIFRNKFEFNPISACVL